MHNNNIIKVIEVSKIILKDCGNQVDIQEPTAYHSKYCSTYILQQLETYTS
jgi:hypothetical protein